MYKKFILSFLLLSFYSSSFLFSQKTQHPVNQKNISWADSVFTTLSLDEKIAQLMVVRAFSNKDETYVSNLLDTIAKYQFGGVCFFQGGIARQAIMTNQMQQLSKIPMMVTIDAEYGLAMRLDSVELYPRQMALGATQNIEDIYKMGSVIAKQCQRMGIHVNFVSCVDVNCNSKNPVINSRSFGANPQIVAKYGIAYMKGMQDQGVMAVAKHFPGHGDTDSDSHFSLPVIKHNRKRLDSIELYPFRQAIEAGIDGMMVGHLNVPALDSTEGSISSTSAKIIKELLIHTMGFNGLVFTDGLEMKGITNHYLPGDLEVNALAAGNDLLLLPAEPYVVIEKIKEAIKQGILTEEDINQKCIKMLKFKEKYVLSNIKPIEIKNLYEDINSKEAADIYAQLTQSSLTLLKNEGNIIPFQYITQKKLTHIRLDNRRNTTLESTISNYIPINTTRISQKKLGKNDFNISNVCDSGEIVLVSLHTVNQYPKNDYGLTREVLSFLDTLSKRATVIFVLMGNPYVLDYIPFNDRFSTILIAYHPVAVAEKAVGEALCGLRPIRGKLPVFLNDYAYNTGIYTKETCFSTVSFPQIDSLAEMGIKMKAYPGCRILIAHKDTIVYNKSFGYHTYENDALVENNDVYDLASITKVAATTLAIMKLYEEDKINLQDKLSKHLSYLKGSNKENISIAEVMTHTAGLKSWIPFYKQTLTDSTNQWNPLVFIPTYSKKYSIEVCKNMYMNNMYVDTIFRQIVLSPLKQDKQYEYSDLGFYLLSDLVYKVSGQTLDAYLNNHFYTPMGLQSILFNPNQKILSHYIPPTEKDTLFRKQLIQAYVHDQGAAMLGGVSGHAGLFASADDLYAVLKMLLNEGMYQGKKYLNSSTIKHFTSYYSRSSRRGLGFDKPPHNKGKGMCSNYASPLSYGHSGFTGTYCWVDPKYDVIYIFLSNRIYPDADNQKITKLNIRTKIQDLIYESLEK